MPVARLTHGANSRIHTPMLEGRWVTRGRTLLCALLAKPPTPTLTQTWLAGVLGVDQSAVSHWTRGAARPDAPLRLVLQAILFIPVDTWLTEDEKHFVETTAEKITAVQRAAVEGRMRECLTPDEAGPVGLAA